MIFLNTILNGGVDITKEIPFKYKVIFVVAVVAIGFLVEKFLSKLFLPQGDKEEALVWTLKDKKRKSKQFYGFDMDFEKGAEAEADIDIQDTQDTQRYS